MMRRPQFSLKTMLWLMALVGMWCLACRMVLLVVREFNPVLREMVVCSFVVASVGIGCLAGAARMNIDQSWQRGAVQFGCVMLGVGLVFCAVFLGAFVLWATSMD